MNQTAISSIPETRNECFGFWGTMHEQAAPAWPIAIQAIAKATGEDLASARAFLDSRHGRHFADEVCNGLFKGLCLQDAIDAAVTQWMTWRIDRRTARDDGIPRGLPYLTGFVIQSAITVEMEEAAA